VAPFGYHVRLFSLSCLSAAGPVPPHLTRTGPSDLDQATGEGEATLRANVREQIEQVLRKAGHSETRSGHCAPMA